MASPVFTFGRAFLYGKGQLMLIITIFVVVGALVAIVLVLRREDPMAATIDIAPSWGTPQADHIRQDIASRGPNELIGNPSSRANVLAVVASPRDEQDFFLLIYGDSHARKSMGALWRRNRCRPIRPKPLHAPPVRIERAPPEWRIVLATRCRICNRALTNPRSMELGVGPDCYSNYGARSIQERNPHHGAWVTRKRIMDQERAAWQTLLDEVRRRDIERFEAETRNWQAAVALSQTRVGSAE